MPEEQAECLVSRASWSAQVLAEQQERPSQEHPKSPAAMDLEFASRPDASAP